MTEARTRLGLGVEEMKSLIRYGHGHRIAVSGRSRRGLRRHPAVDGVALGRATAGRRNGVRADRVAPDGGPTAIAVERVIHGIGAAGHLADRHRCARPGAGIEADVVGRRVSALHLQRRRIVNVRDENALTAEVQRGGDYVFQIENNEIISKFLKFEHTGKNDKSYEFDFILESDGTKRLMDFIPIFYDLMRRDIVYIIDEMERSIHPLLIKELISKFSLDEDTKGQLIFTTHESNLLDQDIFRTDEIWFAEKGKSGSTKLYSLSDYKEHKTIDIQKGYLNGRYGSIPFLGNLHDLNWHTNVTIEEPVIWKATTE